MKITAIEPWLVKADTYWGEYFFVEVTTDAGITGWGEVTVTNPMANRTVAGMLRQLNQLLVGEDPRRIEAIWQKVFRKFTYMGSRGATCLALSGVDIALWDIWGKLLERPIYELLGGPVRDDVPLYCHLDLSRCGDAAGIAQAVDAVVSAGFGAFKFDPFPHLDPQNPKFDEYFDGQLSKAKGRQAAELTEKIRQAAGPDIEILIDAHGRFNVPTAIRLCRALEEAGQIDWFEEPVPVESYHALRQVREQVKASICVGERLHTRWEFIPIFENRLADYVMPDVTWTGGISELKKIAAMAESYTIPISPHDASGPINVVAGAHVMMTVPNCYRLETLHPDLAGYNAYIETPLDNSGGALKLSNRPGLGIEINREFLAANRLAV